MKAQKYYIFQDTTDLALILVWTSDTNYLQDQQPTAHLASICVVCGPSAMATVTHMLPMLRSKHSTI